MACKGVLEVFIKKGLPGDLDETDFCITKQMENGF